MSFDYYQSSIPAKVTKTFADKFLDMHRAEIVYRARLFKNLRYPLAKAVTRIQHNIAWEYEKSHCWKVPALPGYYQQVTEIVEKIYGLK